MGKFYPEIPPHLPEFLLAQKLFWVATAPLSAAGHVNLSPKGGASFGILSPTQFWYLELSGSGIETLSHLHEPGNARITVMFAAFSGAPKIVRIYGKGRVLENGTAGFDAFVKKEGVAVVTGTRSIVVVDVHQVGSSCGFSVPFYEFKGTRTTLHDTFEKKRKSEEKGNWADGIERYWAYKNALSVDNLPGMKRGVEIAKTHNVPPIEKMVGDAVTDLSKSTGQSPWYLLLIVLVSFLAGVACTLGFKGQGGGVPVFQVAFARAGNYFH